MSFRVLLIFSVFLIALSHQKELNFVIYYQDVQVDIPTLAEGIFSELDTLGEISSSFQAFNNSESLDEFKLNFCSNHLQPLKLNVILDLVWGSNPRIRQLANAFEIPYFKLDPTIYPLMEPAVQYIQARNGSESVFIMAEEHLKEQALYGLVEKSELRMIIVNRLGEEVAPKLAKKRPIPEYLTIIAGTEDMNTIFRQAVQANLVKFQDRWNLMFLDPHQHRFDFHQSHPGVNKIVLDNSFYCQWFPEMRGRTCDWPREQFQPLPIFMRTFFSDLIKFYQSSRSYVHPISSLCDDNGTFNLYPSETNFSTLASEKEYFAHLQQHPVLFATLGNQIKYHLEASIYKATDQQLETQLVAQYSSHSGQVSPSVELAPIRRYFRIGTAYALPWSMYKLHPETGEILRNAEGHPLWEGFCIDLIHSLSLIMDFDYDIIEPESKTFGDNIGGKFDGTIGDLVRGETDMVVGALVTTAEREEFIDFVPPVFEQSGISIVIRKPVRTTSLFKFMTVLRTEVWISIMLSVISSAVLVWMLDKYSPYSAQNMKYPFECRYFSLKESFWFALTSYTPQGGGELPKSLSGRTLVATYWLFVVLILATFTANLAAFLTVERMNTPVSSLEQLGKQSRINYTVVEGSDTHKYFINMKYAEDVLYDVWKNMSLESTWDQYKYRVWDYPIHEQYGLMLRAINGSNPVKDAREGFQNVVDHTNADYAFIHDSQEIKYEMMRNCDLTEIGDVFGQRPFAIAIQQGNSLFMDEISKAMLVLQAERYFEGLTAKYWNASIGNCEIDENEGMSLESLGGVFIVTIFGLLIAVVALIVEWIYYWRKAREITQIEVKPAAIEGGVEEKRTSSFRSVFRRRSNVVGDASEIDASPGFGVHKRSVSIVEDNNEHFD